MFQTSFRSLPTSIGNAEIGGGRGRGRGKGTWTFSKLRALNLAFASAPVAIKEYAARKAYYEKYNENFSKRGTDRSWLNSSDFLKLQAEMEKQEKLLDSAIAAYNAKIEKDIMGRMTQAEITSLMRSITQAEKDRLTEENRLMKSMTHSRRNIERDIKRRKEENIIFLTRRKFRDLALAANEYKAANREYIIGLRKRGTTQGRKDLRSKLKAEEESRKKLFDSALAAYRAYIEEQFKSSSSSIAKLKAEAESRKKLLTLAPTTKPTVKLAAAKTIEPLVTAAPVISTMPKPIVTKTVLSTPVKVIETITEPAAKKFNMKTLFIPAGIVAALIIVPQIKKKKGG